MHCGKCQQRIGIAVEHLGGQVRCPHCKAVVQTPARAEAPAAPVVPPMPTDEPESIFAGEVTEDVIDSGSQPRSPSPVPAPPVADATTTPADAGHFTDADPSADLASFQRPRPLHSKGTGPLLVMIFLIPYAILVTLFVLYLQFYQHRAHPLDALPDPAPGKDKGSPRPVRMQVIHNYPLAEHQKVRLGKSLRIGDLEVEPVAVRLNQYSELTLVFKATNLSPEQAFEPIHEWFVRYTPKADGSGKLYTFIEDQSTTLEKLENIYGGIPAYLDGKGEPIDMFLLSPGKEATVALTTTSMYKKHVDKIASTKGSYVWRVQLRRGLVRHQGRDVSATTVIGVEFTSDQIQRFEAKA